MAVFIEPGHDVHAARHTDRSRVVVVIESHAGQRQIVYVRGLDVFVAVASQRVAGLVIGEEKNDVGSALRFLPGGKSKKQEGRW